MSAFKQFTTKDVTLTSFIADKKFDLVGSEITSSNFGVDILTGRNVEYSSHINTETGLIATSSVNSIYRSIKQLYYSNYLSSSIGDDAVTGSIIPGVTPDYDILQGPIEAPLYDNYLQSSLLQHRYFPTGSEDWISVISVPTRLYGEKIIPNTFEFSYTGSSFFPSGVFLTDDGEGNVISGSDVVGQIFYPHGLIVLTTHSCELISEELQVSNHLINNTQISFSSSLTIHEQQYKCTILENEFGYSTNPTLLTQPSGAVKYDNTHYYGYVTESYFEPYVTCVGLYNESKQLMAVGKLSFALPVSQFTDTTIMVNLDMF